MLDIRKGLGDASVSANSSVLFIILAYLKLLAEELGSEGVFSFFRECCPSFHSFLFHKTMSLSKTRMCKYRAFFSYPQNFFKKNVSFYK